MLLITSAVIVGVGILSVYALAIYANLATEAICYLSFGEPLSCDAK